MPLAARAGALVFKKAHPRLEPARQPRQAFSRRFQSIINFPMPKAENRHTLWLNILPKQLTTDSETNPTRSLDNKRPEKAIMREFIKESKMVNRLKPFSCKSYKADTSYCTLPGKNR